jgi:hypothetical protein
MSSKLLDALLADIKDAMKSRDTDLLTALRTLHAQIKDATTNAGRDPEDVYVAPVVAKAIKQRQDAIEQFRKGGREDLAVREEKEIVAYRKYQPEQLDTPAIEALVKKAVAETGASGRKDMSKVMAVLMPQVKGRADGKLVNSIVQAALGP